MADNVLNEEELKFINDNAVMVKQLANASFAGTIGMDKRKHFEQIAWKINGRAFPICWTCGGSIQQVGRLLNIKL